MDSPRNLRSLFSTVKHKYLLVCQLGLDIGFTQFWVEICNQIFQSVGADSDFKLPQADIVAGRVW